MGEVRLRAARRHARGFLAPAPQRGRDLARYCAEIRHRPHL